MFLLHSSAMHLKTEHNCCLDPGSSKRVLWSLGAPLDGGVVRFLAVHFGLEMAELHESNCKEMALGDFPSNCTIPVPVSQLKSEGKRDLYSCWKKCVFVCVFVTQVASAAQS